METIKSITLDEGSMKHRTLQVEHERNVAIADLLDENLFAPVCMTNGPYDVQLSIVEGRLVMDIFSPDPEIKGKVVLPMQPLRGVVRDYFMICESYYAALKDAGPARIEAIDMARRGIHNEGAEQLQEVLKERVKIDLPTSRRLFTLVCVLHIK